MKKIVISRPILYAEIVYFRKETTRRYQHVDIESSFSIYFDN